MSIREQVMREIDDWLKEEDGKRDKRLDKQTRKYLEIIKNTETKMEEKETLIYDVECYIHEMRRYVNKWKWLPHSYQRMLKSEFIEEYV